MTVRDPITGRVIRISQKSLGNEKKVIFHRCLYCGKECITRKGLEQHYEFKHVRA